MNTESKWTDEFLEHFKHIHGTDKQIEKMNKKQITDKQMQFYHIVHHLHTYRTDEQIENMNT